ncbi:MAG: Lrp/AsnC family transcriptional regulator [Candidatus Woesearchaeota archaeon]
MKDIRPKLIELFKQGYCTPQIARIAKKLKEPSTTIHYNIKKLEKEGAIKCYNAVFDLKKINEGHSTIIMVNLDPTKYSDPEQVAEKVAKDSRVESIDICTGEYELIIKLHTKDIDEYYSYIKNAIQQFGFSRTHSLTSLKKIKHQFVN